MVNLTMALLATRRYLTKSEIFRSIEGYEGAHEAKERMFERDKDALRSLGIVIDVRGVDPNFEDEPGYRILPDSYALNLGSISGDEIALLSLAAEAWRGAALSQSAQSALLRLNSIGISSDFDAIPAMAPKISVTSENFQPLTQAIGEQRAVSFTYLADDLTLNERTINPFGLGSRKGNWYLVGFDLTKSAPRTFRLDRVRDQVILDNRKNSFEIDPTFDVLAFLDENLFEESNTAEIAVRRGKGLTLRRNSEVISSDDEYEIIKVGYVNEDRLVDEILWHGDDVVALSPNGVRAKVILSLQKLMENHG